MMEPSIYILKNDELEVGISDFGATITHMIVKDKFGNATDVVLGFDEAKDYMDATYLSGGAYLGAGIGRYGNRIANGKFYLNGKEYILAKNNGNNHLHGGVCGFDKKMWIVTYQDAQQIILHYLSKDEEEGYPGNLTVDICFGLEGKQLKIEYRAVTDKNCYVNLTHHPYFNLDPTENDIKSHSLKLYSNKYLKTYDLIPDGTIINATGDYDFHSMKLLGDVIEHTGGLDDCYIFDNQNKFVRLAELYNDRTGIKLYVCSDYPGLQVYTGRYLNVKNAKGGKFYGPYSGIALEAQFWPDSPHHSHFPSTLLEPGVIYCRKTIYGFE